MISTYNHMHVFIIYKYNNHIVSAIVIFSPPLLEGACPQARSESNQSHWGYRCSFSDSTTSCSFIGGFQVISQGVQGVSTADPVVRVGAG